MTHVGRPFIVLLGLVLAIQVDPTPPEAADMPAAPRMPEATGKDLNGKAWKAPAGFPADRTLVILGYEQEQQEAIDTWTDGMGLSRPGNTVPWVEMPVIDEPGMVMRWIIDTGMQRGIPGNEARSHVWTVYTDRKAFLKSCGIDSVADIHTLVVTREGTILAMEIGRYSDEAAARIRAALGGAAVRGQ